MARRHPDTHRLLITDGGLATSLEAAGHDTSGPLWSGRVLVEDPRAVMATHEAFVRAGANVVITASYQVTVDGLVRAGVRPSRAWRVIAGTVSLARGAGEQVGRDVLVAASSGTWNALRGHGGEYRPMPTTVTVDELVGFHVERARILAEAGPDVLLFETLPGVREVRAAVDVAEHLEHDSWITVTTPDGAHTTDGEPLDRVTEVIRGSQHVTAVGVNCSAVHTIVPAMDRLAGAGTPLIARPNAGATWRAGAWRDPSTRAARTDEPATWWEAGATIVGGCCGTTPDDVAAIARRLR